ncbi:DUF5361 domain-containing protein [Mycolicibacterium smegmatis]|uniref:DUF5361 domain-containing protein n=1 Tax=Mycolicibacterium smegmatis TaxID=1772 RepID=UPI001CBEE545|nr:DUF5361 domain-containing protein [Mycolicibacterium smegmatis]MDF1902755.1 DUF5361 domain-containing protein [Mycolicibacterium smegmatis]MDF1909031.1 DUF5361 domain-containing protein [Mycolicibacterium smegmatis]MDF1921250.1 DUF5361 domain-containing protein [Mycolicibacterium smegmatis]MDF1927515.1 DUF5361 domain-containing protein [Mycolicibacterium smegmatis]
MEFEPLALVPVKTIQTALAKPEDERFWFLLETLARPLDVIDSLYVSEVRDLVARWESDSGIQMGELFRINLMIRRHSEALEADLIDKGLRLRNCPTEDFNWHDLKVIIRYLPVTSNLYSEMFPDRAGWTKEAMLTASVADSLHWLQWAKTKDGAKGRNRPKPIPRPGVTPPRREGSNPKAVPLSVIKKTFADRSKRNKDRGKALQSIFAGKG